MTEQKKVNNSTKAVEVDKMVEFEMKDYGIGSGYYDGCERHKLEWFLSCVKKRQQNFTYLNKGLFKDNDLVYIAYYYPSRVYPNTLDGYLFNSVEDLKSFLNQQESLEDWNASWMYYKTFIHLKGLTSRI